MRRFTLSMCIGLLLALSISACTQMPTEKAGVSDIRPQISFKLSEESLGAARVSIDSLDVGTVSEYLADRATLRVLPGNHRVTVIFGGQVLLDEKIYLGDGVSRTLLVK